MPLPPSIAGSIGSTSAICGKQRNSKRAIAAPCALGNGTSGSSLSGMGQVLNCFLAVVETEGGHPQHVKPAHCQGNMLTIPTSMHLVFDAVGLGLAHMRHLTQAPARTH